jgi:hypothetical protein
MWLIQFAFRLRISCRIFLCSLTLSNTSSFLTWSVQLIFSILLQHHISKLSRCFWSTARSVQVSALMCIYVYLYLNKTCDNHQTDTVSVTFQHYLQQTEPCLILIRVCFIAHLSVVIQVSKSRALERFTKLAYFDTTFWRGEQWGLFLKVWNKFTGHSVHKTQALTLYSTIYNHYKDEMLNNV